MITIITPFKGKYSDLKSFCFDHKKLINSKKIKFIIIDSSSQKIKNINPLIRYFHSPNLNLYEAINYGISKTKTNYYLTLGIDDRLNQSIININLKQLKKYDIASYPTINCEKLLKKSFFRINHRNFVYQHSCSSIFKTSIHKKIGFYPTKLKIASDAFIILQALKYGYKIKAFNEPIIGEYGLSGISSLKKYLSLWEMFKVTFKLGFYKSSIYYFIASQVRRYLK